MARKDNIRDELIRAGIEELNQHSLTDFSVRRIAAKCGVSAAAPYKHFVNKQEFIAEIINHVNAEWNRRQQRIMDTNHGDTRQLLVEFSISYVVFLVENPFMRSILMIKDDEFDMVYNKLRAEMSKLTQELVARYCMEVNMPEETYIRKLYVVRALIYGAALMFDNGEFEYNEENLEFVRKNIDREFDLP